MSGINIPLHCMQVGAEKERQMVIHYLRSYAVDTKDEERALFAAKMAEDIELGIHVNNYTEWLECQKEDKSVAVLDNIHTLSRTNE